MKNKTEINEYVVLARKYRPQTFESLIGQETLVKTLTNSITQNRIAHAYLLTGVRGIGKTTTARLIAMSLNCENRHSDSCEPCGKCESCVSIREDRNLDVIEMDAASKTGVDDIREIIDNIKYKPVSSKYKIFIIDEVHMLSKNAFNALLKTLEEPPPHVKFIFATTEVKKIPITIISRCQRFDLHRISKENLNSHLLSIAKKEDIKIDQESLALIVRSADGSIRDGLSLLDQAIANEGGIIKINSIIKMLGLADRNNIFDLLDFIFQGNVQESLNLFSKIHNGGADVVMIFEEMLNVVHFITQVKIAPDLREDIHIPELERIRGFEISEKISMSSLGLIWQVLFKGYEELQSGYHLFQHGEMIIIRLIYLYEGPSPDDLVKKTLEKKFDEKIIIKNQNDKNNDQNDTTIINQNINQGDKNIKSFRNLVDLFYQNKEGMLHTYLYNNVKLVSFKEGELVINTKSITDPQFSRTIAKLISKWTGRIWQVSTSSSNIGQSLQEEDLINQQKQIEKIKDDPEIKSILTSFPGVKIHSITDINETTEEKNNILQIKNTKE
tara:strand:- start:59 stop:1726 length:1668 start_codon:yes stop_codon:yes gene_type:complete